jgi:photosystem II stability/assembly factor-like uncharacterized protein
MLGRSLDMRFLLLTFVVLSWQPVGAAPTGRFTGGRWNSLGPTRIDTTAGGPWAGRVASVAVDPFDSLHWIVGAALGGIWESRDGGATWSPRTDDAASLASGAIAFAPSVQGRIYAATGESNGNVSGFGGAGILRSDDGGQTWSMIGASASLFRGHGVRRLYVDPHDADVLVLGSTQGSAGIGAGPPPTTEPTGVFRHDESGWHSTLVGNATGLVVVPDDFGRQYAAIGRSRGSSTAPGVAANGLYRSLDGGTTWTAVPGPWTSLPAGVGRIELAIAPSNPDVVYASITDAISTPRGPGDNHVLGLWRTTTAWGSDPAAVAWEAVDVPPVEIGGTTYESWCEDECEYTHVLTVDPLDADVLYAGGVTLWRREASAWSIVDPGLIHVDQHAFAWSGRRLLVGNDGGVFSTTDDGATWRSHNAGLVIAQFYDGAVDPLDPTVVLGGTQDNGTILRRGGAEWSLILGGDGFGAAISSRGIGTGALITTQRGGLFRYNGEIATLVEYDGERQPFTTRVDLCPSADVAIATGDRLLVSPDVFGRQPQETFIEPPTGLGTCPGPGCITALAFAPADHSCATYAVATADSTSSDGITYASTIHVTIDNGSSWATHSAGPTAGDLPLRYVSDLAFAPSDSNVLVAAFSGFPDPANPSQSGHVFRTAVATDVTRPWLDVSPPTPEPATAIAFDPVRADTLYVGTNAGLWSTADGGLSWTHAVAGDGLPNVAVYDLVTHPTAYTVFAFTHGRGAFALGCTTTTECEDGNLCTADTCEDTTGCRHPAMAGRAVARAIPDISAPACASDRRAARRIAAANRALRTVRNLLYTSVSLGRDDRRKRGERRLAMLRRRQIGGICRQRRIERGKITAACCEELSSWSAAACETASCLTLAAPDPACRQ